MLGYGLDERAYDAIRKWRFRPAHDGSGANVATIVPVEVTFRLY
jgi:outer membrane biosynthesis protein TonB